MVNEECLIKITKEFKSIIRFDDFDLSKELCRDKIHKLLQCDLNPKIDV